MNNEQLVHINQCRTMMRYAEARMAVTFDAVPEDHVDWRPAPSAKSALQILSHCVDANRSVTQVLRGEIKAAAPDWNFKLNSKETALRELANSVEEYDAALDAMTPELFSSTAETPAGPAPLSEWMNFIGHHLAEHAGQIDYLQTCWNDQEVRYPEA